MSAKPEVYPACRCGREVRKLNAASDTPKCDGCGYTSDLCRCPLPSQEERAMRGDYDG